MAREPSKILQTPAQKKEAVANLKAALKSSREPLALAETAHKEAVKALATHTKEAAAKAKGLQKTVDGHAKTVAKHTASYAKGTAKINGQLEKLNPPKASAGANEGAAA